MVQAFTKKGYHWLILQRFGSWEAHMHANNWRHFFFLKKTKTILQTHDVQAASVKRQMAALTNTLDPCVEQKIIYLYHGCKEYGTHQRHRIFPLKCSMEPIPCTVNQVKVNLPCNCSTCYDASQPLGHFSSCSHLCI
jgi:hypothetical protein